LELIHTSTKQIKAHPLLPQRLTLGSGVAHSFKYCEMLTGAPNTLIKESRAKFYILKKCAFIMIFNILLS